MNDHSFPTGPGTPSGRAYSIRQHGRTLATCDSEPVHTPGCVQAHGALLVLRLHDLRILQASGNSLQILGLGAANILAQCISSVIGQEGIEKLRVLLTAEPVDCNPIYLMTLPQCRTPEQQGAAPATGQLDVTAHSLNGVVILEFEATGRSDSANPDYYGLVRTTVGRLQAAGSVQVFCDLVAEEVRNLTRMDRVMIHKFHVDGHGEVVAESRRDDLGSWIGMHFPAEDIPEPARAIFRKTWIRPVPDIDDELAELVPLVNPDTGEPLDMTYCALRGASVMYTEYLRNMGVAASLTMPIRRNGNLWGLIACHHYSGPKYISYQKRAACEFLAQVASLQHQAAEDKEHLAYRHEIEKVHRQLVASATDAGGLAALTGAQPSLMDGIHCGGAALYYLDRWWSVGNTPDEDALEALGDWLVKEKFTADQPPLYSTDHLAGDYPAGASFAEVASGLLATPIALNGRNLMLWFRPETMQTVSWRGDPNYQPLVLGPNGPRLTPRRSFELFVDSVRQRSLPWLGVETEAASVLRLSVMGMVIDRAARLTKLNADLTRSNAELDAFAYVASHDLKEPLRGISQYATQLLEDSAEIGEEARLKIDRLKQLTSRMDLLLDSLLHFSRVGRADLALEPVDLNAVLAEAARMVSSRASVLDLHIPRKLPSIQANRVWVREIFVNLLSNAKTFNDRGKAEISVGFIEPCDPHRRPGLPNDLTGQTIFYVSDNGIGIEARYFEQVFKLFKRLHGRDEYGGGGGAGLTIVRKLVERHGGRVWLDSKPAHGTTVYFTLSGKDDR